MFIKGIINLVKCVIFCKLFIIINVVNVIMVIFMYLLGKV